MNNYKHQLNYSSIILSVFLFVASATVTGQGAVKVNALNYVQAKTALHFNRVMEKSGGINQWTHIREPTPLNQQRVSRMNRDTLYSSVIVDISQGATVLLPDSAGRYMSAAVINEDHYINRIFHKPGEHKLTKQAFDSDFVMVTVRILVDANDPEDIRKVNQIQDELRISSRSAKPYPSSEYDSESLQDTTVLLSRLAGGLTDAEHAYGRKEKVDAIKHLLVSAFGWGGLPETEAYYLNSVQNLPLGEFSLTVEDVPVDGFWSISVYNSDGYFEENTDDAYSLNNLTAKKSSDGSFTIQLGGERKHVNFLPVTEGWSYVVRMYRPHQVVLDGTWRFPDLSKSPPALN